MIFIFGDSHANACFKGLSLPHRNGYVNSITMHRVGRDNTILQFNPSLLSRDNTFIFLYGEVDCRCHVARQKAAGRSVTETCETLVSAYFKTIANNITAYKKIIVCAVVPPTRQAEYEALNGSITHAFPFIGTDEERILYTNTINALIKDQCERYGYTFFDPHAPYRRDDGTLKFELSDTCCHIKENEHILTALADIL